LFKKIHDSTATSNRIIHVHGIPKLPPREIFSVATLRNPSKPPSNPWL